MATHDYIISNASGAAVRADLNNALAAIATNNSSATEPTTTYAYQWWADTGSSPTVMKLRNAANSAWITLFQLDGEWSLIPFENGTAAAPSIYFKDSGTDTGLFSGGTDQVNITTGGTERVEWGTSEVVFNDSGANYDFRIEGDTNANLFFVDASADAVGIGTTSPGSYATGFNDLVVGNHTGNHGVTIASQNTTTGRIMFADGTGATEVDVGEILYNHANNSLSISTNRSTALTIDSSGRLLVGTSTALGTNNSVTIKGTASSNPSIFFGRNENASGITAGEGLGFLEFGSGDGGIGAQIEAEADGTWSSVSDCPSRLVFSTTADGAPSPTEAMRITSDARVLFGTTGTPSASVTGAAFTPQTNGRMSFFSSTSSTASQKHVLFFNPNGEVGSISTNASATAYTTSSDYRLKENIIPLTGASERVLQLKPSRFNFIADPDTQVDGFIAHEAQAVVPECVIGAKDEVDEDGNPAYQGIDQSKLVPLLTAALQEAIERIETLEAEVAALKGA
jgi:hypothetical protein